MTGNKRLLDRDGLVICHVQTTDEEKVIVGSNAEDGGELSTSLATGLHEYLRRRDGVAVAHGLAEATQGIEVTLHALANDEDALPLYATQGALAHQGINGISHR